MTTEVLHGSYDGIKIPEMDATKKKYIGEILKRSTLRVTIKE